MSEDYDFAGLLQWLAPETLKQVLRDIRTYTPDDPSGEEFEGKLMSWVQRHLGQADQIRFARYNPVEHEK